MIMIKIDYHFRRHITGSVVALNAAVHNIKISFLYKSKNFIGYCLTINLSAPSKLQKLLAYSIRFIDKSQTNGKLFNMVNLNLVSKDSKGLCLHYFIN